jgi:AcrR family transcriptional regulator
MDLPPKARILKAARQMIEDHGYNNLNINTLAEKAGVAIGTLYWHFKKGKISIVKELAKYEAKKLKEHLKNFKSDPTKPIASFKPFILKYIEYHKINRAQLRAFEIESITNPQMAVEFDKITMTEVEGTIDLIKELLHNNSLNVENLPEKIKLSILYLDDLVHKHVLFNNRYGSDERLTEILINIFMFILK